MTEQETGKRLMRLFLVTPVRVSAGPPLVSRSWCRVAVPFPLIPELFVMGTDDLQKPPAKEQTAGLLIAPGIFAAVLALIYAWT